MEDAKKRGWDVVLGLIAPVLTVAGILVGVWQFNRGQHDRVVLEDHLIKRKDEVEFRRRLWLNRVQTYQTLLTLVGNIVATASEQGVKSPTFDKEWHGLTAIYWSGSIFVESPAVASRLRDFYVTVHDFRTGWATLKMLKLRADALATACRDSIERSAPSGTKK